MKYVVQAGTIAGKTEGETLTDEELASANVHALIIGGHIKPATQPNPETVDEADEDEE